MLEDKILVDLHRQTNVPLSALVAYRARLACTANRPGIAKSTFGHTAGHHTPFRRTKRTTARRH